MDASAGNRERGECDEAHDPSRPAVPYHGLQFVKYDGVDHAAETAARCSDTDGESSLGAEVLRDDGNADNEYAASTDTYAEALCQE